MAVSAARSAAYSADDLNMADPISLLTRENLYSTGAEASGGVHSDLSSGANRGFASLGSALAGGGNQPQNDLAEERGMLVGAQTANAMAQARDRVNAAQQNEKAAQTMESPEFAQATGLDPSVLSWGAAQARAGRQPQDIGAFFQDVQHTKNRATLAASQPQNPALGAAMAEHPEGVFPKAVGTAGSFESPQGFDPNNPNSSPVHISPEQTKLNEAQIDQRTSAADKNERGPAAKDGLPHGYAWAPDPNDPAKALLDSNGKPIAVPTMAANPGEGAVSERNTRRIVNGAVGLKNEVGNISKIGLDASTGFQVSDPRGGGIMHTATENMGKAFSSAKDQVYKSAMSGMENQLGVLELAGGVPTGTYQENLRRSVENNPGDTPQSRLYHMARIRQIAETAAEATEGNPKMNPISRAKIYDVVNQIQDSIPFTSNEVSGYVAHGKPGQTFQQYLDVTPRDHRETFGTVGADTAPQPSKQASWDKFNLFKGQNP
jgi:hypothetical protein